MDIDELMMVVEKNKFGLSKIDDDFYERIRSRIEELEEMKRCCDDFEAMRCEDEIRSLKRLQRKVFEIRTGRIINAAWAEVCGQPLGGDVENMTSEERNFFKKLVGLISEFKRAILEGRKEEKQDYVLVRIKKDVEIQGADGKTYKLRREDVVTLPQLNADSLVKGGYAERIEVSEDEVS